VAIGSGESFTGFVDVIHRKAYQLQGGKEVEVPVPAGLAGEIAARRDQLIEAASEADDDVMAKYLEGEEITDPSSRLASRRPFGPAWWRRCWSEARPRTSAFGH